MAKWSESEIYQQTRGTNRFTRFVGWLNNLMNPNHSWVSDWNQFSQDTSPSEDIVNQITKQALTGAEKEANAFNAQEAQKQRDWEEQMSSTAYQRQAADMRAAGVNPALMMNGGSSGASTPSGSSAASVSPSGVGMSMSDIMQLMLLPANRKILSAQAANIAADTEKKQAETQETFGKIEQLNLINKYYPQVTESTLSEIASRIGVNMANVTKTGLESELLRIDKIIRSAEADHASEFYKWRAEYEKAHTQEAKDNAAAAAARAAWDIFETDWTKSHGGARPSSSAVLALVSAISGLLGLGEGEGTKRVGQVIKDKVDEIGGLITDPVGTVTQKGQENDQKIAKGKKWIRKQWNRFETWRNKPKRVF